MLFCDRENGLLNRKRMFVGLSLSHPAAQSARERRLEMGPSEPSIVGVRVLLMTSSIAYVVIAARVLDRA